MKKITPKKPVTGSGQQSGGKVVRPKITTGTGGTQVSAMAPKKAAKPGGGA
jgi:hypothetical protein